MIDCYFRAHMEYKRPDVGLKIYREALARFKEFSNPRLGVYTTYAHENSNPTLHKQWEFHKRLWSTFTPINL